MKIIVETKSKDKQGRKNLILATLVCVPGPLWLAISMRGGANSTQIADLIKRSFDFLTVALAWLVYELTTGRSISETMKLRLEKFIKYFTALSMCIGGAVMIYVSVATLDGHQGNMFPSLFLAATGALINVGLVWNYRSMKNPVLMVQAKLHSTKALLDFVLVAILLTWMLCPYENIRHYVDLVGTNFISLYLIWSGLRVLKIGKKKPEDNDSPQLP